MNAMTVLMIVGVVAATAVVAWSVRGARTPAPVSAVTFGAVCLLFVVGLVWQQQQNNNGLHDTCIARVNGREDVRAAFLSTYAYIDTLAQPGRPSITQGLRDTLNTVLPPFDIHDC